jgi:hypothetical protein
VGSADVPEWLRIETSYRQMNQAKATTCSRHPLVRLFLVGVAVALRNV